MFNNSNVKRYQQPLGGNSSGAPLSSQVAGKYTVTLEDGTSGVGVLVNLVDSKTGRKLKLVFADKQEHIYREDQCKRASTGAQVSPHPV